MKSFDAGAIEDITCHQLHEMSQPFFCVCKSAQARGTILIPLREMFPGVEDNCFTILNGLSGNGGGINAADVVSFIADGRMQLGELMVAVGISRGSVYDSHAIISMWSPHPESADVAWPKYVVSRDMLKWSLCIIWTQFSHTGCLQIGLAALYICHWRFDPSEFHLRLCVKTDDRELHACICAHVCALVHVFQNGCDRA